MPFCVSHAIRGRKINARDSGISFLCFHISSCCFLSQQPRQKRHLALTPIGAQQVEKEQKVPVGPEQARATGQLDWSGPQHPSPSSASSPLFFYYENGCSPESDWRELSLGSQHRDSPSNSCQQSSVGAQWRNLHSSLVWSLPKGPPTQCPTLADSSPLYPAVDASVCVGSD